MAEWERTGSAQFGCLYWEKGVSYQLVSMFLWKGKRAKCPDEWILDDKVNKIHFNDDNNEIEYLLVVNIS